MQTRYFFILFLWCPSSPPPRAAVMPARAEVLAALNHASGGNTGFLLLCCSGKPSADDYQVLGELLLPGF